MRPFVIRVSEKVPLFVHRVECARKELILKIITLPLRVRAFFHALSRAVAKTIIMPQIEYTWIVCFYVIASFRCNLAWGIFARRRKWSV